MAEIQRAFSEYINRLKEQLKQVDDEFKPCANSADGTNKIALKKCLLYEDWFDKLTEQYAALAGMVCQLQRAMEKNSSDESNTSSTSTDASTKNRKPVADLLGEIETLRVCLRRTGMQSDVALKCLRELQSTFDTLNSENKKLCEVIREFQSEQNEPKNSSTSNCNSIAPHVIASIKAENEELRRVIAQNEQKLKEIDKRSVDVARGNQNQLNECADQVKQLQHELAEKDRTIENLSNDLHKMTCLLKMKEQANATCEETIGIDTHRKNLNTLKHTNKKNEINTENDELSITDTESHDDKKLNLLEEGTRAMASLLKEKYELLRKQRAKIGHLMQQIDKCNEEKQATDLRSKVLNLETKNANLKCELDRLQESQKPLNEFKEKTAIWQAELKNREEMLSKKVILQEEHIKTLLEERQNLIQLNNQMLESINLCEKEFKKYTKNSL